MLGSVLLHHTFYWHLWTSSSDNSSIQASFLFMLCQNHISDSCASALMTTGQPVLMKHYSWPRSLMLIVFTLVLLPWDPPKQSTHDGAFDYVAWLGNHSRISFVLFTRGICESEKIIFSGQRGVVTQVEGEILLNMLASLNPPQETGGEMRRGEIGLRKTEWKCATMCERPRVHESKNPISGKRHFNRN